MSTRITTKEEKRLRRHNRVRARVTGSTERPRLNVHRSLLSTFAQLIDDSTGKTIASVHTKTVSTVDVGERTGKIAKAYAVGKELAEKAKAANITSVVFDRGGYGYHGRVAAVAEGARDGGLQF